MNEHILARIFEHNNWANQKIMEALKRISLTNQLVKFL